MTNTETQPRFIVCSTYRPELARDMFYVVDTQTSTAACYEIANVDLAIDLAVNLNETFEATQV